MPDLSRAEVVIGRALHRLTNIHGGSTEEINALQALRAELDDARRALAVARETITAASVESRSNAVGQESPSDAETARFAAVFEHALDAILIADDTGRYLNVNPAACSLLGYSREQMLGLTVRDITPEALRSLVPQAWSDFLAVGTMSGEYTVCHRDGRQIPVEFRAVANILPGQHLSILRDVSRLRQAQADMHLYQRDKRAQAAKTLYSVLDMLVAAKIGLNSESSWRRALIGQAKRELGSEINEAIAGLRKALASLETTDVLGP